jgi:hypothetical protein
MGAEVSRLSRRTGRRTTAGSPTKKPRGECGLERGKASALGLGRIKRATTVAPRWRSAATLDAMVRQKKPRASGDSEAQEASGGFSQFWLSPSRRFVRPA